MSQYYGSYTDAPSRSLKPPQRSSSAPSPNHLRLPPSQHHKAKARHPKGELNLPSQTVISIRILFQKVFAYLASNGEKPATSTSQSLGRLSVLTEFQLLELLTDICDEIERRAPEEHGQPSSEPFLPPNPDFSDSRNMSRQKLATLKTAWFRSLVTDVWTEIRRRHREFTKDEIVPQTEHAEDEGEDEPADDVVSSFAPVEHVQYEHRQQVHHPQPVQAGWEQISCRPIDVDEEGSDQETIAFEHSASARASLVAKPGWLLDAENMVQKHLGPGRSSHDYLHADRCRRDALSIARSIAQRHQPVDFKVVELSALFINAVNDPKHAVRDAKDFIAPYLKKHHTLLNGNQGDLIIRICRAVSVKKEERRRREKRETDWHKTCVELHCVSDSDKLDQLGCFGILRTAASYGTSHKPLFDTASQDNAAQGIRPGNCVSHFLEKERILSLMHTSEGRQLGQKRYARMQQFALELAEEYSFAM